MAGLYVHIPWCVRKCPYCDFNSHESASGFDEISYVDCLLRDLSEELDGDAMDIDTVYFGGGTPSLFKPSSFERILSRPELENVVEVSMEANPGTTEYVDFRQYKDAGITRLSIGAQSFNAKHLNALGRIHGPNEISIAFENARKADFDDINLDLMYGLPNQSADEALDDLKKATELGPSHISWYELTIEPNTVFGKFPPALKSDDYRAAIGERGIEFLTQAGFERYEISAFGRNGSKCRHNVNYWTFGDYVGIGAGAHGKRRLNSQYLRSMKPRMPQSYMSGTAATRTAIARNELPVEFMMNALRLTDGVDEGSFLQRTGLPFSEIQETVDKLRSWDLMVPNRLELTQKGLLHLNSVLTEFVGE